MLLAHLKAVPVAAGAGADGPAVERAAASSRSKAEDTERN
jgi:hypothetical protein